MSLKDKAAKILSKFSEPRGVAKETERGVSIFTPRTGAPPLEIGGKNAEEAALLHTAVLGEPEASKKAQDIISAKLTKKEADKLKEAGLEDTVKIPVTGIAESAFKAPGTIKNKALKAIAEKLRGVPVNTSDEDLPFEAVDAITEKLGVSPSSQTAQTGKAALAAAIQTVAPENLLDVLPVGKIAGKAGKVVKAPGVLGDGAKAAREGVEYAVRKLNESTFFQNMRKEKAKSIAEQLLEKGAKEIKGAKIFSGKK